MGRKKRKFRDDWANQTALGKKYGISAIVVGKLLVAAELKDAKTKLATSKALNENYAQSTPLKDGTPHFMWNIEKVRTLITKDHSELTPVEYWANHVRQILEVADQIWNEGGKFANLVADSAYDDVPVDLKDEVRKRITEPC